MLAWLSRERDNSIVNCECNRKIWLKLVLNFEPNEKVLKDQCETFCNFYFNSYRNNLNEDWLLFWYQQMEQKMVYRVEVMVLKGFRQLNCLKKDFFWRSLCFEYTIPCRRRRETLLWWIFKLIFNQKRGTNDRKECYLEESQMLPGNAVRGDRKYWHRSTQRHLKIQGNLSIITSRSGLRLFHRQTQCCYLVSTVK